jgi:urea transporter
MTTSPLTTIGGILAAIGAVLQAMSDPVWHTIGACLAAVGLALLGASARDNKTTSEQANAGK